MSKKEVLMQLIPAQGMLPLYFHKDTTVSLDVLKALYEAGIRTVEYTNRGAAALENFRAMRELCDREMKDMYLGVGTIKNAESAEDFIEAGADYIICPGLVEAVAEIADSHQMLWVPGCMTPTEIIRAESLGAKMVKLFPGNLLGPSFVSAIKSLFPDLMFMPTGGVDTSEANLKGWFDAGVTAVGMGSKLISKSRLDNKAYAEISDLTKQTTEIINRIKKTT